MGHLVLLLPFLLPPAAYSFYLDRRLRAFAALLLARCPDALAQARGRPRAWYDGPDTADLRRRGFRERAIRAASTGGSPDAELAKAAASVERVVRWEQWVFIGSFCLGLAVCRAIGVALA